MSAPGSAPRPPGGGLALRVPPVALSVILAALMWAADRAWPSWRLVIPGRAIVALALFLVAAAIGIAGVRAFHCARTTSNPLHPERASSLVSKGIYRHTRNPMYVALALALLAWAVWLGHALAPAGVVAFVAWMNRFQIAPEERALQALFGEEFARYCAEVRRWL
jgi:protein-S-isoprenylcysteine O-methyltransferase Ste14